ncbi:acyl-CoA dehydrogenase family protein [Streptomyces sp. NPDC007264]|uniref:acyl-CoA dehydrogenase family protein n=1 Tax=Streptomyces sp. NPDC007264 TaxID=3364777 RepID=UPI0036DD7188
MDFYPDPDHREMADAVAQVLAREFSVDHLRETESFAQLREGLWSTLAEQGLFGTLVPETSGGLGLGWNAAAGLLREIGRAAVPGPFVDTVCVAPAVLRAAGGTEAADLLEKIGEGSVTVGVVDESGLVADASSLDLVLVPEKDRVVAVTPGHAFVPLPTLDTALPCHRLRERSGLSTVFEAPAAADPRAVARNAGALATAAALNGVTAKLIDLTRDYVAQREQFGRVIGGYQAVQHALVDAALLATFAAPVVDAAAWELENGVGTATRTVAHAKAAAAHAATAAGRVGLQLHGAIGYTWEYDLQHWFKRAMTLGAQWGNEAVHRATLRRTLLSRGGVPIPGGTAAERGTEVPA